MQERKDFWRIRHAIPEAEKYTGPAIYHDISVPISKIPELIEQSIAELEEYIGTSTVFAFGHVGDGNLHFTKVKPASMDKAPFLNETANVHRIVHEVAVKLGGSFSAEHGIGTKLKNELEHFSDPVKLRLLRTIKNSMDPKNIMNPNKLIG
jgi:FAD/FMN-containing dehydrogenase